MIPLDVATDRLLHQPSYRQAFLDGRYDELDLSADDLSALQQLDRQQLIETAAAVRSSLLERKHRGSGGIRATYPETLAAWQARHDDGDLSVFLDRFMASEAFDRYHEVPHAGFGYSLEEAVYRFFESEDIGDPAAREREFLAGICKALALNPRPAFTVDEPVRRGGRGWFAVSQHEPRSLFAAVDGRYVQGQLTPFLVDLLTSGDSPTAIGSQHGVTAEVVHAALAKFRALGLLAHAPRP